ncbi:MAG: lysophospholipid acyltransferase family protein [Chlorobium sp.]|uniref:lysophospholipid acyltransferase family protein n=1 Tax=Chlorobium sp. TaxID=1095 RepID=UPI0025BB569A|nr:lysophospholipid acyltransferase family protein [Chlorobium sp.]MCF8382380.1 lysophospholipid acyltransferase family protein [Chlorobium sp.]
MLKVRRSRLHTIWFGWYSRRQFRRYFNTLRVFMDPGVPEMDTGIPVVFYCNHAYWWDGFWSQLCTEEFFRQNLHIIIEYPQLNRHRFFTRLGAFSIDRTNARSALRSLDYAAGLLTAPSKSQNALWLFPQGRIEHVDRRPLFFFKGTAGIVSRVLHRKSALYLVSVVSRIEYLEEQKPELLLSFRPPLLVTSADCPSPGELTSMMRQTTEDHLDGLKALVMNRSLDESRIVIHGRESINRKVERYRRLFGIGR